MSDPWLVYNTLTCKSHNLTLLPCQPTTKIFLPTQENETNKKIFASPKSVFDLWRQQKTNKINQDVCWYFYSETVSRYLRRDIQEITIFVLKYKDNLPFRCLDMLYRGI